MYEVGLYYQHTLLTKFNTTHMILYQFDMDIICNYKAISFMCLFILYVCMCMFDLCVYAGGWIVLV